MSLLQLLIFFCSAFLIGQVRKPTIKLKLILVASGLSIYWLQPASSIRNLDFWLPTLAIFLVLIVWIVVSKPDREELLKEWPIFIGILLLLLILYLPRILSLSISITATKPPGLLLLFPGLLLLAGSLVVSRFVARFQISLTLTILLILGALVVIKYIPLSMIMVRSLRALNGQDPTIAKATELAWLGYSYLAFRLLHVLRDKQANRTSRLDLRQFLAYCLFFPAYPSGPIDRYPRFTSDLANNHTGVMPDQVLEGGKRVTIGIFKKFVLADSLAILALNPVNASQILSSGWMWIALIAFSFRIYFDFSGYTDIAIGLGNLMGLKLPENFNHPYQATSLIQFWNSWHITLADWFRSYFFYPLIRFFRSKSENTTSNWIIFLAQVATMALIGLWHGITVNFLLWGVWHGIGLYINNRWASWSNRINGTQLKLRTPDKLAGFGKWVLTFGFVTLGWVWFVLPDFSSALLVYSKLIRIW